MTSLRKNGRGSKLHKQTGYSGSRRKVSHYGWLPDLPDPRDRTYAAPQRSRALAIAFGAAAAAPPVDLIDLRDQCPPVYNQGRIGSCTANAIAGALEFCMMKEGQQAFTPSRLFIYYNERSIEGRVPFDAGAFLRDGIKSVASEGDCPELDFCHLFWSAAIGCRFPFSRWFEFLNAPAVSVSFIKSKSSEEMKAAMNHRTPKMAKVELSSTGSACRCLRAWRCDDAGIPRFARVPLESPAAGDMVGRRWSSPLVSIRVVERIWRIGLFVSRNPRRERWLRHWLRRTPGRTRARQSRVRGESRASIPTGAARCGRWSSPSFRCLWPCSSFARSRPKVT